VTLLESNVLNVRLAGKPGSILTVSISPVVGRGGGFVETAQGTILTVSPGSLNEDTAISLDDMTQLDTGISLPVGYSFVHAVAVDLSGAQLSYEADLAVPINASLPGPFIAAQVLMMFS
jgi:hypothetical protein